MGTREIIIDCYLHDMCEGLNIMTVRGSAYLLVGQNVYPLIEGIVPPTLHFYIKEGYLDIYGFWRVEGEEHAAHIRVAIDKVHVVLIFMRSASCQFPLAIYFTSFPSWTLI